MSKFSESILLLLYINIIKVLDANELDQCTLDGLKVFQFINHAVLFVFHVIHKLKKKTVTVFSNFTNQKQYAVYKLRHL